MPTTPRAAHPREIGGRRTKRSAHRPATLTLHTARALSTLGCRCLPLRTHAMPCRASFLNAVVALAGRSSYLLRQPRCTATLTRPAAARGIQRVRFVSNSTSSRQAAIVHSDAGERHNLPPSHLGTACLSAIVRAATLGTGCPLWRAAAGWPLRPGGTRCQSGSAIAAASSGIKPPSLEAIHAPACTFSHVPPPEKEDTSARLGPVLHGPFLVSRFPRAFIHVAVGQLGVLRLSILLAFRSPS